MDRASEDKAVRLLRLPGKFRDDAAKDARAGFPAPAAADAAADGLVSDPEDLGLHAGCLQGLLNLLQGPVRAAVFVRAAVDQ